MELIRETFHNLQTILTWGSIVSDIWKGCGKEVIIHIVPSLLNQHCVVVALPKHVCDGRQPRVLLLRRLEAPHVHVEDLQIEGAPTGLRLILMEVRKCKLWHRIGEKPWGGEGGESVVACMVITIWVSIMSYLYLNLTCLVLD